MAEASRNDAAGRDIQYPPGTRGEHGPAGEPRLDLPELPETATPANKPVLNRSAEAVGRGVGSAVAGVRRLPKQFDKLRSRIHLVPSRQGSPGAAEEIRDAAVEAAAEWRDAAEDTVSELTHRVRKYTHDASESANRRWDDLQRRAEWRISELRRDARKWVATAGRWPSERPLYVIGACAAISFAAGVAIRIWRSNRD